MDRAIVRGMVEDYWRAVIPAMQNQNVELFKDIAQRFEKRIADTAASLAPLEKAAFEQAMEAEREIMIAAYQEDPAALKQRLGVPLGIDSPRYQHVSGRQSLGEIAVKTAVRATVWETVWALFRMGR